MKEYSISLERIAALLVWAAVVMLVLAGWVAYLLGNSPLAHMLGLTACATSAGAAVLQVRCYISRVLRLIRAQGERLPADPIRSLH